MVVHSTNEKKCGYCKISGTCKHRALRQSLCSGRGGSAGKQTLIRRDGQANLASPYARWVAPTVMGDPGLGGAKLDGVACRVLHGRVHQDSVVGRLRGWEEEDASWVAVKCGGHAIESLLADEARVEVGEGDGKLNLGGVGALEKGLGRVHGRRGVRTRMRMDTAITTTKTSTASSNHCSQFSKLRPEFARLRRSSGWRESCSQRRARVADLRAQIVATIVKVMEKPMSTMAESLKKRRKEGMR